MSTRPGAGRPKGSKTVDEALEYLQKVYRGKIKADPRKVEAARAVVWPIVK